MGRLVGKNGGYKGMVISINNFFSTFGMFSLVRMIIMTESIRLKVYYTFIGLESVWCLMNLQIYKHSNILFVKK